MKFTKGLSGNPRGRPKGIKDRRVALREKLTPHADDLIETVIRYALSGDMQAIKLVFDRVIPPLREEKFTLSLPKIESADDCVKAQGQVIAALANGDLLPSDAHTLSGLIEAQRKAYETTELSKRLAAIEAALQQRGN